MSSVINYATYLPRESSQEGLARETTLDQNTRLTLSYYLFFYFIANGRQIARHSRLLKTEHAKNCPTEINSPQIATQPGRRDKTPAAWFANPTLGARHPIRKHPKKPMDLPSISNPLNLSIHMQIPIRYTSSSRAN